MHALLSWLSDNTLLVSSAAGLSVMLLAVTILATPWAVSRLPSDYLLNSYTGARRSSVLRRLWSGIRAMIGVIVVLLGVVMLVTPGPGVVMLLLGVSITEFPGKHRLLVYLATRPNVLTSLNWMRRRHGKPPFVEPGSRY